MKTWVIASDLQIPWHDPKAVQLLVEFIRSEKPHGVVLNGDLLDCYTASDFSKDPARLKTWGLQRELREAGQLLDAIVPATKERIWHDGNHEDRWRRVMWQYPNLVGMFKTLPDALRLKERGFVYKPYGGSTSLGKLLVTHGSIVRKHAGDTARAHFEKYGTSVCVGHSHRMGFYAKTDVRGPHLAIETGCLCRLTPEYVQAPDWQQAFAVVHVEENGFFSAQLIPVLKRRVCFYGAQRKEAA